MTKIWLSKWHLWYYPTKLLIILLSLNEFHKTAIFCKTMSFWRILYVILNINSSHRFPDSVVVMDWRNNATDDIEPSSGQNVFRDIWKIKKFRTRFSSFTKLISKPFYLSALTFRINTDFVYRVLEDAQRLVDWRSQGKTTKWVLSLTFKRLWARANPTKRVDSEIRNIFCLAEKSISCCPCCGITLLPNFC